MRSAIQFEESYVLQMHWTEQFFKETERDVRQGDFIEAMHNVMFYATMLFQSRQEGESGRGLDPIGLPLAWQWGGEEEVVARVKATVPSAYSNVLDFSLAASASEECDGYAAHTGMIKISEVELRQQAAAFIRYAQEQLKCPDVHMGTTRRPWQL